MSIDVYPTPADITLGTMAKQNANNVDITGGKLSIGGHAPTGVLDVQGSVVASDIANFYPSLRIWPVAPAGATALQPLRVEVTTGAASSTTSFYGLAVVDQPASSATVRGVDSGINAGTNRYNFIASGTAQNYFAGNVGIANTTPTYPLDVTGDARMTNTLHVGPSTNGPSFNVQFSRAVTHGINIRGLNNDTNFAHIAFYNAANTLVGTIQCTATATAFNTSSDGRLKHAVQSITNALELIKKLNPVKFKWNADDSPGEGFLAHELQQVIPLAVSGEPDALNDDGSIRPQQVDLSKIIPLLVGAVQTLAKRVELLEARLV